jgi:hypothetical protein
MVNAALLQYTIRGWVQDEVGLANAIRPEAAIRALLDLGCHVERCRGHGRATVADWAEISEHDYPGDHLLLFTRSHALVAHDGYVLDCQLAASRGDQHPYADKIVGFAFKVR